MRTFAGDMITIIIDDRKLEGTFTVDPAKKPKEMDAKFAVGEATLAIYHLDGDTLKVLGGDMRAPRPKELSGNTVTVFKRDKAEKK